MMKINLKEKKEKMKSQEKKKPKKRQKKMRKKRSQRKVSILHNNLHIQYKGLGWECLPTSKICLANNSLIQMEVIIRYNLHLLKLVKVSLG